ncbi:unnamed protein product [Rotaria magnacalcarata]|uniref:Major facilitator superfamily associated domain-containing protein n=1 Tax=Rotaria magnacalcarata TaxID=392030 RepID=A0A8S2K525_9BILA|nr:unnamed protein product [Rotaria magnacalcarata]
MASRDAYQNTNDPYRQHEDHDQTELYEYDNEKRSSAARLRSLFGPNLLQKPPRILRDAPNLLNLLPASVDRTLLYAKLFYFWYFAAFGSLFPLLSIYFKQMGMGPSYCGILMGFRAPAITLADAYTLTCLAQDTEQYGRQRMYGSLGWGLAIFIVATILDQSKSLTSYACGTSGPLEKNYTVCFAAFTVCMIFAFITATRFQYSYDTNEQVPMNILNKDLKRTAYPPIIPNNNERTIHSIINDEQQIHINVNETLYTIPDSAKLMQIVRLFMALKNGTFLFITWWMGCGVGLVFTFLFWHLQDLGGSPTLFGVASVINHISELFAYFFLYELIHRFGHIKILYMGLLGNFIRFVYISMITNPWWVLPFEFIQGVLQGFHFGFGRGCGALFGGFFASYFGTDITFRAYGILCLILMLVIIYMNNRYQQQTETGYGPNLNLDDPHQFMGNSPHLAPYGAPANPKWQTKFSSGLTVGIKQDQLHSIPITSFDTQTTPGSYSRGYHYGY